MPTITVEPIQDRAGREAVIRFPFRLYKDDPHWVPPLLIERREFLNQAKNPVFEYAQIQLFLARKDGEVAGTIAAIRNDRYGEFHPEDAHVGFFGLFECIDDQAVAAALIGAAGDWLRSQGKTALRGPFNFTTNDIVGLLVDGFDDDPAVMMSYNPPYYGGLLERAGFVKAKDMFAFEATQENCAGVLDDLARRIEERGRVKIRQIDLGRLAHELIFIRHCYNEAWSKNWGFVPWTDRELAFIAKELKPLAHPKLCFVAEVDGEPAGFMISIPDAFEALKLAGGRLFPFGLLRILWRLKVKKVRRVRSIAMGVLPRHRRLGVDVMLIYRTIRNGLALGYQSSELSWILEDNEAMLGPLRHLGATRTKTYRIFEKAI